jgi:hypothetical protein
MTSFKKNLIATAIASSVAAFAGNASAVVLNADGLGEALIYPYYTARGDQNTFVSIVNTTTIGKVVKVRFREGRNSNDVLDFNLYLSPYDVWTGLVRRESGGSILYTADTSCTDPVKADWAVAAGGTTYGQPFFPFDYNNVDRLAGGSGSQTVDRTLEGYMEVISMADMVPDSALFKDTKHSASTGRPACATVSNRTGTADVVAPTGGLFGGATIADLSTSKTGGTMTGYGATAYGQFSRPGRIFTPASANPNFSDHGSTNAVITDGTSRVVSINTTGLSGATPQAEAFAMVNMASRIVGEYSVDTANLTAHTTDWVVTMPAKHYFTNRTTWLTTSGDPHGFVSPTATSAIPPFRAIWDAENRQACETVLPTSTSREEDRETSRSTFSPAPPGAQPNSLCYESTVISFGRGSGASGVLQSTNNLWYQGNHVRNGSGWLDIDFRGAGRTLVGTPAGVFPASAPAAAGTVVGLPVIGFQAEIHRVTQAPGVPQNNFSGGQPLHAVREVQ